MQGVMTIQEFQAMMAKEESGLVAIFRQIASEATPWDLQKIDPQDDPGPISSWVGWR